MKLTVLGKYGPFPAAGGACSGYLVECGNTSIILDFGSGALSKLLSVKPNLKIDAIFLSHLHSDHMSDMLILRYALQQYSLNKHDLPVPVSVAAPSEPIDEFKMLSSSGVFDITPMHDKMRLKVNDVNITLRRMIHSVPTYAIDIEYQGKRLFYTADTAWSDDLPEYCRHADLLLANAGFSKANRPTGYYPHLSAEEAGILAKNANVKQLIITHLWGGKTDKNELLKQARFHFSLTVLAEELQSYTV